MIDVNTIHNSNLSNHLCVCLRIQANHGRKDSDNDSEAGDDNDNDWSYVADRKGKVIIADTHMKLSCYPSQLMQV